jgi:hypothetical protein
MAGALRKILNLNPVDQFGWTSGSGQRVLRDPETTNIFIDRDYPLKLRQLGKQRAKAETTAATHIEKTPDLIGLQLLRHPVIVATVILKPGCHFPRRGVEFLRFLVFAGSGRLVVGLVALFVFALAAAPAWIIRGKLQSGLPLAALMDLVDGRQARPS